MEEFIENFEAFREWLKHYCCITPDSRKTYDDICKKFDELGLNDVF